MNQQEIDRLFNVLARILYAVRAPATSLGGSIAPIPKSFHFHAATAVTRRTQVAQIPIGSFHHDQEDVLFTLTPNGAIDASPNWSGITGAVGSIEIEEPLHLRAIARLTGDGLIDVFASASVDNPNTPDIEIVTSEFMGDASHSKATDLGGSATGLAKGAGFP